MNITKKAGNVKVTVWPIREMPSHDAGLNIHVEVRNPDEYDDDTVVEVQLTIVELADLFARALKLALEGQS